MAPSTASVTLLPFTLANLSLILGKGKDSAPIVPGWIPVVGALLSGIFQYSSSSSARCEFQGSEESGST